MLGVIIGVAALAKLARATEALEEAKSKAPEIRYVPEPVKSKPKICYPGIRIGMDSNCIQAYYYQELIRDLISKGFTDITFSEIREQKQGFFNKNIYGRVLSLSINGYTEFEKDDTFPKDAHICVSFEVFKESPPVSIPELDRLAEERRRADEEARGITYCEYCDSRISLTMTVCCHCGAPVTRRARHK